MTGSNRSTKLIRNSTAEFLIFTSQAGEQSIEARYGGGTRDAVATARGLRGCCKRRDGAAQEHPAAPRDMYCNPYAVKFIMRP